MHWNGGAPLYECKLRCIHIVLPLFPVLLPLLPSCIHTMLIEGGCIIGRSTFREPLPSPSSTLKPYRELRRPLSNRIVLHRPLHARLNTPPRLHQTPPLNPHAKRETYSGHMSVHERARIKRNTGRAPPVRPQFKRGQTPAKLLPSALYLHEARQTTGKNRTPPPLPHLLLHHFLHSSDGFR